MSTIVSSTKRRFNDITDEYDQESPLYKRLSENQPTVKHSAQCQQLTPMPSITYASPDYRPPVSTNALWLQPSQHQKQQQPSAMAVDETDSTDEDELAMLVQTPSSILDEKIKGSLESGWSNGSLEQWHQV